VVLDASIATCWLFEDEDHPHATEALARVRNDEARVPSLWWFEIRNTLLVNERRGRLTEADTAAFFGALSRLAINVDRTPGDDVLALARRHRLTIYDAAYLELAQREGFPLATLDSQLASAARVEKVAVDRRGSWMSNQPSRQASSR
jgi:predicted nucleic acid-binding protein